MQKQTDPTARRHRNSSAGRSQKPESSPITPQFILESMRRWWLIALPTGIALAAVSSALIWYFFTPVFESRSVIRIGLTPTYLLDPEAMEQADSFVQNELAILRSPMVLGPVLTSHEKAEEIRNVPELKGKPNQEDTLQSMIRIQSIPGSELHYVFVKAENPEDAQMICNAIVSQYKVYRDESVAMQTSDLINTVDAQIDLATGQLKSIEDRLRAEMDELKTLRRASTDESDVTVTPLTQLQATSELLAIDRSALAKEIERLEIEIDEDQVKDEAEQNIEPSAEELRLAVEVDDRIGPLKVRIENLRAEINSSEFLADHPDNLRRSRSIAATQTQIDTMYPDVEAEVRAILREKNRRNRENRLEQMIDELARMDDKLASLGEAIKDHEGEIKKENREQLDIELLLTDLRAQRQIYREFQRRKTILETERWAPDRVMTSDNAANLPSAPVETIPVKEMGLASIASMILPFLLAILWELSVRRVSNPGQVISNTELPIIGEISVLPVTMGRKFSKKTERQMRLFEESVDAVRTSFFMSIDPELEKVISVTSAVANEGKTTIASQIAISISRASGKRVLLIDGDLRAPDIHRIFDLDNETGMADVLQGKTSIDDAVAASWEENLFILPAGRLKGRSPHQLIGDGKLLNLMKQLRERFDTIVIDSSPVLSSSESLMVNQVADHTLVSVMRDVSRVDQVAKVSERLRLAGIDVAGCVLSGVPQSRYAYSYGVYETIDA